jgi:hypothetical protein
MDSVSHANKREFRRRFVLLDPLAIDKQLLYQDSSGKFKIGLILETERGADGRFPVRQAAPAKLTRAGVAGQIVGHWKFLDPRWDGKGKAARNGGSAKSLTRKKSADAQI